MATSMGKTIRLARLFDPDSGTAVMLPIDHAIEEPDYTELKRPLALVEGLARAGVIKTWYTGDPESFRRVLGYSLVAVVVAGRGRPANAACWRWCAGRWTPARPASRWAARSGSRVIRWAWPAR
jgi:DhnA family fructose-bisphosphate aldolase class Ia